MGEQNFHRSLAAEPLEGRWLLSGARSISAVPVDLTPVAGVQVIEHSPADEDDTDDPVALSDIPATIVDAMHARFSGAKVIEASFSDDDGPEYSIVSQVSGKVIDMTFAPDGRIIDTEETVAENDLPQAVLDWIRENYPNGEIEEAAIVLADGEMSYEVLVSAGAAEFEASLRVVDDAAPREPSQPGDVLSPVGRASRADMVAGFAPADSGAAAPGQLVESVDLSAIPVVAAAGIDLSALVAQYAVVIAESAMTSMFQARAIIGAGPLIESAVAPLTWAPQVAGLISDAIPPEIQRIEAAISNLLATIDDLAQEIAINSSTHSAVARLALVAALVISARLLLLSARRRRRGPVLVFNAGSSSWSWILGPPPRSSDRLSPPR